jgi:hypothetical protein
MLSQFVAVARFFAWTVMCASVSASLHPMTTVRKVSRADIDDLLPLVRADQMGIDPDVGTWLTASDDQGNV